MTLGPVENSPSPAARGIAGLIGGATVISALFGAAAGYGKAWPLFGFETVCVLAGLGAILFALGRIRQAHAMALACIAGTIFVCGVLGYISIMREGLAGLHMSPKYWGLGRVGLSAVLVVLAVVISILPNKSATRTLLRAILWAVPLVAIGAWYKLAHLAPMSSAQSGFVEVLRLVGMFVIAAVCGVSLCAFIHCAIRAFEIAYPERREA